MAGKFQMDQVVVFNSRSPKAMKVNGRQGHICGEAFDSVQGKYLYAVMEHETEIVYACYEDELTVPGVTQEQGS